MHYCIVKMNLELLSVDFPYKLVWERVSFKGVAGYRKHGGKIAVSLCLCGLATAQYQATWDSLDKRPLPKWYDEAKLGIFMHWGVFSVSSFSSEWFWEQWKGQKVPKVVQFMEKNYPPDFEYPDFAPHV